MPLPPSPTGRTYGWRLPRLPYSTVRRAAPGGGWAPNIDVDLRPLCPPVRDQGTLGACSAFALSAAAEFAIARERRAGLWRGTDFRPSPLWLYYRERALEGTLAVDAGASLHDGLRVLRDVGVAHEADWPYDVTRFATPPDAAAELRAGASRVVNADLLAVDADTLLATLTQGYPVVFGVTVFASFEDPAVARTGRVPLPRDGEDVLGGHAMLAVGVYREDGRRRVRVQNSWGTGWGESGYGSLPLEYLTNPGLAGELIAVRVVRAVP